MNKFSIDEEVEFKISDEIFSELNNHIKYFEERGMEFALTSVKIKNHLLFYKWIIERLFPEYKIEDHQRIGITKKEEAGCPDFRLEKLKREEWLDKCKNNSEFRNILNHFKQDKKWQEDKFDNLPNEIWIEVKKNSDGLHANQFNWILEHRDKTLIKILFIKEDEP